MNMNVWTQYKNQTERNIAQSLLQEEIDLQCRYREQPAFLCVTKKRINISFIWGLVTLMLFLVYLLAGPFERNPGDIVPVMVSALIWMIQICTVGNQNAAKYMLHDAIANPETPFSQLVEENIQECKTVTASKKFHISLCLAMILGSLAIPIADRLGEIHVDGMFFRSYRDGCILVDCGIDFNATHVVIPEQVQGKTVVAIYSDAFTSKQNIVSVDVPGTVTSIGTAAFADCSSLKQVVLNSGIPYIPAYAFRGCTSLEQVTIPDTVTTIGAGAFIGCTKLESIVIPELVTEIQSNCFENCSNLKQVALQEGITAIHSYAFRNCSALEQITFPDAVTSIGAEAFAGCSKLESIVIPELVTEIRGNCFENCSNLKQVALHEGITAIHGYAFRNCSALEQIVLPSGITDIRECCFENCEKLKSIVIPEGVIRIGSHAFMGCKALESVTVPSTVREIGSSAFRRCTNLKSIEVPEEAVIDERSFKESPTEVIRFEFSAEQLVAIDAEVLSREPDVVYFFYETDAGIDTVYFPYTERVILIADDPRFVEYLDGSIELESMENYAEVLEYLKMAQSQGADTVEYHMYTQIGSDIKGETRFFYVEYSMDEMIRHIRSEMAGE